MSYFNQQQIDGFLYGVYVCSKCGELMKFTDRFEDELYCEKCGHTCPIEDYGNEKDEYDENGYFILRDSDDCDEWYEDSSEEDLDEDSSEEDLDEDDDEEIYREETDELSHGD